MSEYKMTENEREADLESRLGETLALRVLQQYGMRANQEICRRVDQLLEAAHDPAVEFEVQLLPGTRGAFDGYMQINVSRPAPGRMHGVHLEEYRVRCEVIDGRPFSTGLKTGSAPDIELS